MEPDHSKPRRRLALAQCAPILGDVQANLALHLELTERALAESADLVAFPELGLTGYFLKDLVPEVAMSLDDQRLEPLLRLSKQVDIVTGMVLRSEDFRYYNAAVYMSGGEVSHVHRKVYLPTYGMFDEQRYFAAGDRVRSFDARGVRAGVLVCEDLWHLSTAYLLFIQGISLLVCISSSPGRGVLANPGADLAPGSVGSWRDLLRTIGTPGQAAETGHDGRIMASIRGGPPFNRPTNLAVAPSGEIVTRNPAWPRYSDSISARRGSSSTSRMRSTI